MKIISIANQKGGCGKTTTTINLAASLSRNGKKTLMIDLDPQAHASLGLNFENQDSIYNVISNLTPRKLSITDIIKPVEENFDIAPSNILVGTLEQELADEIGREVKLTDILSELKGTYDYVLIDCPPSLGFLTINSIRASQEVVIPVETSRFSLQGVEHLLDIIHLIRDRLNHQVDYKILITMFDSRLRHSFSMLSKIREKFSDDLFDTIVHINVKLKESAVMGQTVIAYDKYCRGSKDYFTLAKEIIASEEPVEQTYERPAEKSVEKTIKRAAEKIIEEFKEQPEEQPVQATEEAFAGADDAAEEDAPEEIQVQQAEPQEKAKEKEFQPLSERMKQMVKEEAKDLLVTRFTLEAPDARSVYVTGSFNDWSLDENCRMRSDDSGTWYVDVTLRPGVYKYQFIVDGRWREDPSNPRQERNSFGDINSLLEVKANGKE